MQKNTFYPLIMFRLSSVPPLLLSSYVSFFFFLSALCRLFCVQFFYCLFPLLLFGFLLSFLFCSPSFSPVFLSLFLAPMGFISSLPQLV
jgi:hypothetical protein